VDVGSQCWMLSGEGEGLPTPGGDLIDVVDHRPGTWQRDEQY
jgi:hypothetical protein